MQVPSFINLGVLNINTPQQNSSVFVGESVITGMDANMKFNTGLGATFGFFDAITGNININLDNFEIADGNIYDQDFKPNLAGNI